MGPFPSLPGDFVAFLFNLDHGKRIYAYCKKCDEYTEQVVVSYSELPSLKGSDLEEIIGRFVDLIPGAGLFAGKPTVCRCKTLNR
jgi:ribosomal protein L44E